MTRLQVGLGIIELVLGNLVDQQVDAIVNAANSQLAGGGGVDGALHQAAGPQLLQWCQQFPLDTNQQRCPTGEVRVTAAGNLAARWVIHAVGPVYHSRQPQQAAELLRLVHTRALVAAVERDCQSIAFPAISTGVYGYPVELAAPIALGAARDFLLQKKTPSTIRFILFNQAGWQAFQLALQQLNETDP